MTWAISWINLFCFKKLPGMKEEEEPEEEDEEELGHAETYAEYMPMKCTSVKSREITCPVQHCCTHSCIFRVAFIQGFFFYSPLVKIGERHPDPVVETSSLSSVSPPNVWYRLSLPEETIDRGWLSALQLEAITYASQVRMDKLMDDVCNPECGISSAC